MLHDFHLNRPYGRLGEHSLQGRWEGYVENFQYNQALAGEVSCYMQIELLADHPLLVPVVSGWHFDEWSDRYPGTTRAAWTAELAGRCERDRIPITFVALVDSEAVGSASLVVCDMDTKLDLSPWLAAVYVRPAFRHRGIATALVTHALVQARRFGVLQLYLWTDSAVSLYSRLGWRPLAEEPYKRKPVVVMVRDLTG
jgi:GNAT superfamily N-acetyltransferase